ncbi:MAG: AarF/ABC1/UbiB kinase family protein [Bacteriovoracaceae bacterium]|nr:AarF/ABC1/UbiB kinase family protein [Bacteriovoracaceae bacterium]
MNKIRTSRLSRLAKIGTSLAKVAGGYAVDKIITTAADSTQKLKTAQELIRSMGELKGGLMKIGQMLSITDDMILPPEISALFKDLQKNSPPMSYQQVEDIFMNEFKQTPSQLFKEFSKKPIAAASIGQVHEAVTKQGDKVAVKIQYPNIEKAIQSDLSNLDQLDKIFSLIFPHKPNVKGLIREITENLLLECNYQNELNEMIKFKELYAQEFPEIYIPNVYPELSCQRILTTEFVTGDSFEESKNYPQAVKEKLATTLYNSFLYSLFVHNRLHTDPQNGNYLFKNGKIILLDFGSTKTFTDFFIDNYILTCAAVEHNDLKVYQHAAKNLGLVKDDNDQAQLRRIYGLSEAIYRPFLLEGAYPVQEMNPLKMILDFIMSIEKREKYEPLKEFVLLDRSNIGLFTKLKQWQAAVNWHDGRKKYQMLREKSAIMKLGEEFNYLKKIYERQVS